MLFDCGEEVDEVALPKLLALHHQTKPNHHHRRHRRLQTIIITKAMHWNIFRHSQIKKPSNLGEKDVWTFPADPPSLRIFTYALTLCTRMWSSLAEVVSPMFAQGLGALSAFYFVRCPPRPCAVYLFAHVCTAQWTLHKHISDMCNNKIVPAKVVSWKREEITCIVPQASPGLQGAPQILCPHNKSAHQSLVSDALGLWWYSLCTYVGVLLIQGSLLIFPYLTASRSSTFGVSYFL